jgi:hypothetical protein
MPKQAKDYTKTIMYKIRCLDLTCPLLYVGHTSNFKKRESHHKQKCNSPLSKSYHLKVYKTIRDTGGWNNWTMEEIEEYTCTNNKEATLRERYWYEMLNASLNMNYPARTRKEYKIVKNTCACGGKHTNHHKHDHLKSKKHINYIVSLDLTDVQNQYLNTD